MNRSSISRKFRASHLAALLLPVCLTAPGLGATISFVGIEVGTDTNSYAVQNWSNLGVSKLYDLGGSEVYGTSGYYQIRPTLSSAPSNVSEAVSSGNDLGITATNNPTLFSAPVFLSSLTGGAGTLVNFGGYQTFRGPDGSTLYRQGGLSVSVNNGPFNTPSGNNNGYFGSAFSLTMASNMGADFRLGIAVDTVGSAQFAPDYVSLFNSGTGSVYSTQLSRDGNADMAFFDITASAGESFSAALWQLAGTQSVAVFSLITFDVSRYKLDVASGLQTNSAVLSGAPAALVKTGAGTTVLTGVSTYQGTTTISNGAVEVGGSGRLASGSYTGAVSLTTNTASLRIATTAAQTLSGAISGSGSLSKSANGTLTLSGSNSYSGGTTISGGRLIATSANALGDAAGAVTVSGGAYLDVRTNITRTGTVTFDGGFLATADGAPASLINNGGGFVLTNAAEIVAQLGGTAGLTSGGTGTNALWRSNSYTGATVVSGGTLTLRGAGALSTNTTLQVASGATFSMTGDFAPSNNVTVAGLSGAGTVTGGAGALTIDKASGSDTFSGQVTGGVGLTKAGLGTLVLSGSNSYSGGTLISAGALELNGALLSGGITNNASLVIHGDLVNVVSGTGSLTKTGSANTSIWVSNTYSGATVIEGGSVKLDGAGMISSNSALRVDSGASFSITGFFTASNNVTVAGLTGAGIVQGAAGTLTVSKPTNTSDVFTGSINGGIALTLAGSTQLWLAGSNSYTGVTTVGGADNILNLVHANGLGSTVAGTTVGNGSVLRIQGTNNGGSGITVGAEALTIIGQGRGGNGGALRSVSGTNTWQGKVTLSGDARIGSAGGSFLTLDVASGNAVEAANFNLTTEGAGHLQVNDAISLGTGSLTKLGTGSLILATANSYSGGTTLSEGFLRLDNASAAGSGSITQVTNNSTLQINTTGTVANAMSIFNVRTMQTVTLSGNKTLNNATYTVDAGTTTTESGSLSGAGGITKQGTGTLIVTGNNSYTGAVAVDAGVLNLNSSVGGAAATTSSVSVANGATLLLSQSDQVSNTAAVTLSGGTIQRASGVSEVFGSLNLTASSFLDFSGGTAGTIEFSGISYTPSALLVLNIANFTQGNTLVFQTTSNLSLSGFSFSGSGGFGSSSFNGTTFTITAIPEPSTWLTATGLLGLLLWSSRKRLALVSSATGKGDES
jgi:autotransporter-associated beta strand protein